MVYWTRRGRYVRCIADSNIPALLPRLFLDAGPWHGSPVTAIGQPPVDQVPVNHLLPVASRSYRSISYRPTISYGSRQPSCLYLSHRTLMRGVQANLRVAVFTNKHGAVKHATKGALYKMQRIHHNNFVKNCVSSRVHSFELL